MRIEGLQANRPHHSAKGLWVGCGLKSAAPWASPHTRECQHNPCSVFPLSASWGCECPHSCGLLSAGLEGAVSMSGGTKAGGSAGWVGAEDGGKEGDAISKGNARKEAGSPGMPPSPSSRAACLLHLLAETPTWRVGGRVSPYPPCLAAASHTAPCPSPPSPCIFTGRSCQPGIGAQRDDEFLDISTTGARLSKGVSWPLSGAEDIQNSCQA